MSVLSISIKPFTFLLCLAVFCACDRSEPTVSGDSLHRYEADEPTDLSEDMVFGTGRIYVENARPYEDIIGAIMTDAWTAEINGNGPLISDLEVSDIMMHEITMDIGAGEADSLLYHLEDVRLILENEISPGQGVVLGEMILVDVANGIVRFSVSQDDLSDWLRENRPDQMYFEYELRESTVPDSPLHVKYEVLMEYEYSYVEKEDKNG